MGKHERGPEGHDDLGLGRRAGSVLRPGQPNGQKVRSATPEWDHAVPIVPPFGDPNQALFNCTGNLSPEVADPAVPE
ncbi:MAG: hypothetical protein QOI25_392 [Mycobacterium sp.]|jgi:hypothetical protein|nr:hypothetical protein [Mycobacterium sp.]